MWSFYSYICVSASTIWFFTALRTFLGSNLNYLRLDEPLYGSAHVEQKDWHIFFFLYDTIFQTSSPSPIGTKNTHLWKMLKESRYNQGRNY